MAGNIESQTIVAGRHRWFCLSAGSGPTALCLHGAGGSADSFRPLIEVLGKHYSMHAPDLPGHGSTKLGAPFRSGLEEMAEDISVFTEQLGLRPEIIIGHSAGAAVALELNKYVKPSANILINAALGEFEGIAGWAFPALARALAAAPFSGELLSRYIANERRLEGLLSATGSRISPDILARYKKLAADSEHIKGTLRMMAAWRLDALQARLHEIETPTLLIAATGDTTVPSRVSAEAAKSLPNGEYQEVEGGHLVHEEAPTMIARKLLEYLEGVDQHQA